MLDRWWTEEPVVRRYFEVVLETGENTVVFHDGAGGRWFTAARRVGEREAPRRDAASVESLRSRTGRTGRSSALEPVTRRRRCAAGL